MNDMTATLTPEQTQLIFQAARAGRFCDKNHEGCPVFDGPDLKWPSGVLRADGSLVARDPNLYFLLTEFSLDEDDHLWPAGYASDNCGRGWSRPDSPDYYWAIWLETFSWPVILQDAAEQWEQIQLDRRKKTVALNEANAAVAAARRHHIDAILRHAQRAASIEETETGLVKIWRPLLEAAEAAQQGPPPELR